MKKQQTLLQSDFKDSTETKKEVDALKLTKTPKFKENSSFSLKKLFKNPSTHPPSNRFDCCGKSPGHHKQTAQQKTRRATNAHREATGELFASPQKLKAKLKKIMHFSAKLGLSPASPFGLWNHP